MTACLAALTRPFGAALGVFILVNLALALEAPGLSVTHIWLEAPLGEPLLSLFATCLGTALVAPRAAAESITARWLLGGIFLGFALLLATTVIGFYERLAAGRIVTDFPLPMSLFVCLILVGELVRVSHFRPARTRIPAPARFFFKGLSIAAAFVAIHLVYIVSYGHIDFRRQADAAVVFGAKVDADGRPCTALSDRLDTAIQVYRQGLVGYLIMTGARDAGGRDEPAAMATYAVAHGIPSDRIILDPGGTNTQSSAVGCGAIARQCGFEKLLLVTQYFHCARVKLAFDRAEMPCYTVPTCSAREAGGGAVKLSREGFFLLREAMAFPFYWLYYR